MNFDKIVLHIPHSSKKSFNTKNVWSGNILPHIDHWCDIFTDLLYKSTTDLNITSVIFPYTRFDCDAERLINDELEKIGQGIVYTKFEGLTRTITNDMESIAYKEYWKYQYNLASKITPTTLLIDCHSFPCELSDIDICIGFNEDWSKPSPKIIEIIKNHFTELGYKVGINTPYSNSISPKMGFEYKSVMIEINKGIYLQNDTTPNSNLAQINSQLNSLYKKLLK